MTLVYRLLADLIVVAHLAYVWFVIIALVLTCAGAALRWKWVRNLWFRVVHILMIGVVVAEAWCGIVCPLTTWENELRKLAGQQAYSRGFIANLLHHVLFFNAEPWVFTLGYTFFGIAVIATFFLIPPRFPRWLRRSPHAAHD